ncbi:MAG TPA: hypothetical protein VEQ65_00780, partial [Opitutus sp.]|nr:hypothetical protein [Opitutus sp.]
MTRQLLFKLIRRQERALDTRLDYLREIAESSPAAFLKFGLIAPLGLHRRFLPKDAWHVARVTGAFAEDCGTCVQIAINLARRDGVPASFLRAIVGDDPDSLPFSLRDVYLFTRSIAARRDEPELRATLRERYGADGLIEIGLAAAVSRVIPTLKRALGHAQSCALLKF